MELSAISDLLTAALDPQMRENKFRTGTKEEL